MKPPQGLALVKFPEGFDPDMTYQLRERDPLNLEEMQRGVVSAEANLIEKRARRSKKRVTYKYETMPSTSSYDTKMDNLMRTLERMIERISLNEGVPPRENEENAQNINRAQNFRRDPP